jgi:hypothetical protein
VVVLIKRFNKVNARKICFSFLSFSFFLTGYLELQREKLLEDDLGPIAYIEVPSNFFEGLTCPNQYLECGTHDVFSLHCTEKM